MAQHDGAPSDGPADETPDSTAFLHDPVEVGLLTSHPSLAVLAGRGWAFEQFPQTSTAVAFGGALLISLVTRAYAVTVLVMVGLLVAGMVSVSALLLDDRPAVRLALRASRAGFVVLLLLTGFSTYLW